MDNNTIGQPVQTQPENLHPRKSIGPILIILQSIFLLICAVVFLSFFNGNIRGEAAGFLFYFIILPLMFYATPVAGILGVVGMVKTIRVLRHGSTGGLVMATLFTSIFCTLLFLGGVAIFLTPMIRSGFENHQQDKQVQDEEQIRIDEVKLRHERYAILKEEFKEPQTVDEFYNGILMVGFLEGGIPISGKARKVLVGSIDESQSSPHAIELNKFLKGKKVLVELPDEETFVEGYQYVCYESPKREDCVDMFPGVIYFNGVRITPKTSVYEASSASPVEIKENDSVLRSLYDAYSLKFKQEFVIQNVHIEPDRRVSLYFQQGDGLMKVAVLGLKDRQAIEVYEIQNKLVGMFTNKKASIVMPTFLDFKTTYCCQLTRKTPDVGDSFGGDMYIEGKLFSEFLKTL